MPEDLLEAAAGAVQTSGLLDMDASVRAWAEAVKQAGGTVSLQQAALVDVRDGIAIFTNVISPVPFEVEQAMIEACRGAQGIMVDLVRFTRARSHLSSWNELIERFRAVGFEGPVEVFAWGAPDDAEPETTRSGRLVFFSADP